MADNRKKMAAALAAVNAYLDEEEAAARQCPPAMPVNATACGSMWSHSGRQEMMAMRRLIQLRVFDRLR